MSFKTLDPEDFLVSADSVTATAWSTNSPTLSTFFTSSTTSTNDSYYKAAPVRSDPVWYTFL